MRSRILILDITTKKKKKAKKVKYNEKPISEAYGGFKIPKKSDKDDKKQASSSSGSSLQKPTAKVKTLEYNNSYGNKNKPGHNQPFNQKKTFEGELVKAMEKPAQKSFDIMGVIGGMKTLEKSKEKQYVEKNNQKGDKKTSNAQKT